MRQGIKVTYTDGTEVTGVAGTGDFVKVERKFDVGYDEISSRMEYAYYLGFLAMNNAAKNNAHDGHVLPASFDAFLDVVDRVAMVPDEELAPLDPTA